MNLITEHTFHIPVMGLGFTIDTPLKVGHLGISSVVSIVEDHLIEDMREVICKNEKIDFIPILKTEDDYRAKRISAYLNLLDLLVKRNTEALKHEKFTEGSSICRYFELLPENSNAKKLFCDMLLQGGEQREKSQEVLREYIVPGAIDVNIMTKVDKTNYDAKGEALPQEYSDALSALRGFAKSKLSSAVVFSAGLNPRLYSYCEKFADFFPPLNKKKIILKVSDYRSALIQGKFLAKKGLWVSEFRIESGLNCGGHAFASEGLLLGPILEEFKNRRDELYIELYETCVSGLAAKGLAFGQRPDFRISAQGGIGTALEDQFLRSFYELNATGWGSPFLLVPESTSVDNDTLMKLAAATPQDYYLSHSSPLGVPFNNFRPSSSEIQRKSRIAKNRPGSPCYLKFLSFNTEFTEKPICVASREYQNLKIKQLKEKIEDPEELNTEITRIVEKDCLCEGLGTSARLSNKGSLSHGLKAVAVCPGPNLAYFSGIFSLKEMVDHIYGRTNILNSIYRPHMFINELKLYVDYLKKEVEDSLKNFDQKRNASLWNFKVNLLKGIEYYFEKIVPIFSPIRDASDDFAQQLMAFKAGLNLIYIENNQVQR
ncbi:MAG: hypothetical protein JNL60_04665 [Bacteroidia bacterium]|nr:hypothetical protein [Bacteroidia bacterium]